MTMLISLLIALLSVAYAFRNNIPRKVFSSGLITSNRNNEGSSTALFYTFFPFKKTDDDKKEIGRLLKNILFPGIYREYEDTKEVKKTIKVSTKTQALNRGRNADISSFYSDKDTTGSYNSVDPKTETRVMNTAEVKAIKLKPISKPANFASTVTIPKKGSIGNFGGISVLPNIKSYTRPTKPIILYEYEGSSDCKRVREACTMLDVSMDIRPCPGATSGWSDQQSTLTLGGLRTVPFMIDNNPSMIKPQLTGADDIINHLYKTYGPGADKIPGNLKGGGLFGSGNKSGKLRKNARPDFRTIKPLTLYGYEGVGSVKGVREVLTDLGLAHTFIVVANGSANKDKFIAKYGFFEIPCLLDPNTGVELFNAKDITKYLETTYTI